METNEPQVETEENFPEEKPIDPGPGQDILDRLPNQSRRYLIPTLQKIQEVYRYLPASIMEMVMRKMKITRSELYGVISFYPQLRITEPGKYIIKLCYGTACFVKGAPIIGDKIYDSYHIRPGETDESKLFTLQTASCLGNCGAAPMAIIGEDTHGCIDPEKTKEILSAYKKDEEDDETPVAAEENKSE